MAVTRAQMSALLKYLDEIALTVITTKHRSLAVAAQSAI